MLKFLVLIIIIFITIFLIYLLLKRGESYEKVFVEKVIDGDTFITKNNLKIRLIGVNAPEINEKCYYEAKEKLKNLIENKEVLLKRDKDNKDKYGRLLRYVYLNESFINLILIKEGYAYYFPLYYFNYQQEFREAEIYAKQNKIGCLWS